MALSRHDLKIVDWEVKQTLSIKSGQYFPISQDTLGTKQIQNTAILKMVSQQNQPAYHIFLSFAQIQENTYSTITEMKIV